MQENEQGMPMGPIEGGMPPVPVSPEEAPMADPSLMGGQSQVDPGQEAEMRFDLERMLGKINDKDAAFKESQALNVEKLEGIKSKIIKEMFSLMEDLGIDPSDLNSINEFLQKLQYQDPDLYILFESALNSLSPEEMVPGAPGMEAAPIPGTEAAPGIAPGMEAAPGIAPASEMSAPIAKGSGTLMEDNTTNLQENILRQ